MANLSMTLAEIDAALLTADEAAGTSGILKGDGAGGVSAAVAGTDYHEPGQDIDLPSDGLITQPDAAQIRFAIRSGDPLAVVEDLIFALSTGVTGQIQITTSSPESQRFLYTAMGISHDLWRNEFPASRSLSPAHCRMRQLSNYGATGAIDLGLPTAEAGLCFTFCIEAAQNVELSPQAGEVIYLNGTALTAGNAIENTSPALGQQITFRTIRTGSTTYAWLATTTDAEWVDKGTA